MPGQNFDISSLLQFYPPKWLCPKCYALLTSFPYDWRNELMKCPACGVEVVANGSSAGGVYSAILSNLRQFNLTIEFDDLISHSRALATIALNLRRYLASPSPPASATPARSLLLALQQANKFVHFTSRGLGLITLGALKLSAMRVNVRGVVTQASDAVIEELTNCKDEVPNLEVKVFERDGRPDSRFAIPHQKLVVIDGLLAFKGSANLTDNAWRNAAKGFEMLEVVTDVKEILETHNRYFSPLWAETRSARDMSRMSLPTDLPEYDEDVVPF